MQIQVSTKNHELFARFADRSTLDIRAWWPGCDTGYLKDGETEEFSDGCTATRVGMFVVWVDPGLAPVDMKRPLL